MLEPLTKFLLAYLIGTIMGGLIVGFLRGRVDLRSVGSGNVGATNALRTQGKGFALAVLLIDVGKGILAATLVPGLPWPGAADPAVQAWLPFACGLAAALGHVFPVWFRFRGGKGAATMGGIYVVLLPWAALWMLAAFALIIMASGYVGLATLGAATVGLFHVACVDSRGIFSPAGAFAFAMLLLILFTHRSNLARLLRGEENRFEKAAVLRQWLRR